MVRYINTLVVLLLFAGSAFASRLTGSQFAQDQYLLLEKQLEVYRALAAGGKWALLPEGTCLQPGDSGDLVLMLRQNLLLTEDLSSKDSGETNAFFDESLREGVRNFQRRHGLAADGIVGQHTLDELRVSPPRRVQQILFNMQRWQAFYAAPAQPAVFVNIPDYTLYLLDSNYQTVWQTRVVVGLPGKSFQTLPMDNQITYLVFNPTWTVPSNIIRREIIPIMQKDPGYLSRNHMQVYRLSGSQRTLVPASSINWATADPEREKFLIVQQAGPWNSLGKIKFMFPNAFSIYLHDTPAKALFNQPQRAYSHGCVRVQHPEKLAAFLLNPDWSKPLDLTQYLNSNTPEYVVRLAVPVQVRLGYFTAWVNDAGLLQFRKDIYNLDVAAVPLEAFVP